MLLGSRCLAIIHVFDRCLGARVLLFRGQYICWFCSIYAESWQPESDAHTDWVPDFWLKTQLGGGMATACDEHVSGRPYFRKKLEHATLNISCDIFFAEGELNPLRNEVVHAMFLCFVFHTQIETATQRRHINVPKGPHRSGFVSQFFLKTFSGSVF